MKSHCLTLAGIAFAGLALPSESSSPADVEAAIGRVESILGKYEPKDPRQFRIRVSRNEIRQPEENQPRIRDTVAGMTIYGTPYRVGDAACFDILQHHRRAVYRLDADDEETVIRQQQRYFLARVSLRMTESGLWDFQMTFLGLSSPSAIGKTYLKGGVRWLEDGFQLNGTATDKEYTSSGDLVPTFQVVEIHFSRQGERLVIDDKWQGYLGTVAEDGSDMTLPDFKTPVGEPGPS